MSKIGLLRKTKGNPFLPFVLFSNPKSKGSKTWREGKGEMGFSSSVVSPYNTLVLSLRESVPSSNERMDEGKETEELEIT